MAILIYRNIPLQGKLTTTGVRPVEPVPSLATAMSEALCYAIGSFCVSELPRRSKCPNAAYSGPLVNITLWAAPLGVHPCACAGTTLCMGSAVSHWLKFAGWYLLLRL